VSPGQKVEIREEIPMYVKKLVGVVAVLAVAVLGTGAGAEQAAPTPDTAQAKKLTPEETLTLKKDEVRTLEVKELTRIAVGDPRVADISASGTEGVRIQGRKQGETTLLVWTKDGTRKAYRLVIEG
jgi:Flp pilus assembly secretin CpaC